MEPGQFVASSLVLVFDRSRSGLLAFHLQTCRFAGASCRGPGQAEEIAVRNREQGGQSRRSQTSIGKGDLMASKSLEKKEAGVAFAALCRGRAGLFSFPLPSARHLQTWIGCVAAPGTVSSTLRLQAPAGSSHVGITAICKLHRGQGHLDISISRHARWAKGCNSRAGQAQGRCQRAG